MFWNLQTESELSKNLCNAFGFVEFETVGFCPCVSAYRTELSSGSLPKSRPPNSIPSKICSTLAPSQQKYINFQKVSKAQIPSKVWRIFARCKFEAGSAHRAWRKIPDFWYFFCFKISVCLRLVMWRLGQIKLDQTIVRRGLTRTKSTRPSPAPAFDYL